MPDNQVQLEPTEDVPFAGRISRPQFDRVHRLLLPWWANGYVVAGCVLVAMVSLGTGWSTVLRSPLAGLPDLLFAIVICVACAAVARHGRNKAWKQYNHLHGDIRGALGASGIEWHTPSTSSRLPWDKLLSARADGELVLLFYAPRAAFFFPRSFFASDLEWRRFRDWLVARRMIKKGAP